ncbi:proto-oncogene c-Rel isoform X2 [Lucilia sericata]|uniref:proto-oncogene c-Rel isoform X2 n=1 Tax=Lucilia sericata TaxID=13632 RepID=UPI0018A80770|nr:proto-oncogene c-Rel isoform X2 [Lucilia sericata]XP_037811128.1 proto-oncogene c-Rel isoform X2 [Lucilia sericata]XP_037811138.1 proto-oncogene c-Rel isoform X2 [Lucilia sericata]
MYQNPANNNILAGGGGAGGGVTSNNPNAQIMDPIQQQQQQQQNINYNGMQPQQQQPSNNNKNVRKKPYVKITEQPAGKALRFRYECEGRSAGSIPGVNSTPENKTYPTIEIVGYKGRAVVVVSCVTKDQPYRPHPHNLVGKEGCKKGVCTLEINSETMRAVFSNLGIQCVKKKDIEAALKAREEIRVDPFKTGFAHRFQPSSIDLNSVRLCFQVFMESDQKGRFTQPLPPVVSEPIYDKKAMSDLVICRLCSCSATVLGNTQIILLCEKVAKEDISVRFYEENNGQTIWEAYGEFQHTDVHKQTAIAFKTPRYRKIDITEPAKVFIQLKRPSDGVTSEPLPFEYVPLDSDPAHLRRKRQKTNGDPVHLLLQQQQNLHQNDHQDGRQANMPCWNASNIPAIKTEPRDTSPQPFGMYRAPPELTPSPQPLSPSSAYTHNTPSPYSIASSVGAATQGNQQLISPNQQYNATNPGPGGGNNVNPNAPPPMDIGDYNAFGQQTQQQQQQQQYHGNNFGSAGATHWETKFNPAAATANNNLSNLNNTNTFTMHNLLTPASAAGGPGNGTSAAGGGWNLTPNHFHPHQHHLQQQQQQQQQQYQQHQTGNDAVATNNNGGLANTAVTNANNGTNTNNNNNNNNEHGLSNLLTFDSEQLVRINSEDQQMLRLNSEDLQISNLSIST